LLLSRPAWRIAGRLDDHYGQKGKNMNNLNQILVEGIILENAVVKKNHRNCFTISSVRYMKDEKGEYQQEVYFFNIETGHDLGVTCEKNKTLAKAQKIRVIGRLVHERTDNMTGRIYILAEHIVLMPRKVGA
jgi:single-stranded DNA-binding protein